MTCEAKLFNLHRKMIKIAVQNFLRMLNTKEIAPRQLLCESHNTVKKISDFSVPSREVTYQTVSGRE
jgi:hypothetical protein